MTKALAAIVVIWLSANPAVACRLALALALDVSGSVDQNEYRLQSHGLADALTDPDVQELLFAMPSAPVAVAIYEWSASNYQRLVQDWTMLDSPAALHRLTAKLRRLEREPAPERTGLGGALKYAKGLFGRGPTCWGQTLDISSDGTNNDWPLPLRLRSSGALGELRVNALVIVLQENDGGARSVEIGELPSYFASRIIHGPDAFVEVSQGFEDYSRAMTRKLLRELAVRPTGALPPQPGNIRRF